MLVLLNSLYSQTPLTHNQRDFPTPLENSFLLDGGAFISVRKNLLTSLLQIFK